MTWLVFLAKFAQMVRFFSHSSFRWHRQFIGPLPWEGFGSVNFWNGWCFQTTAISVLGEDGKLGTGHLTVLSCFLKCTNKLSILEKSKQWGPNLFCLSCTHGESCQNQWEPDVCPWDQFSVSPGGWLVVGASSSRVSCCLPAFPFFFFFSTTFVRNVFRKNQFAVKQRVARWSMSRWMDCFLCSPL